MSDSDEPMAAGDSGWTVSMEPGAGDGLDRMASGRAVGERVEPLAMVRVRILALEPGQADVELEFGSHVTDRSGRQRAVLEFAAAEIARVAKEF